MARFIKISQTTIMPIALAIFLCLSFSTTQAESYRATISIDTIKTKPINPLIFGHNAIAYDPCTYEKKINCSNQGIYSNCGAGQWNPLTKQPDKAFLKLAKTIKPTILRFPGGCGVHHYNWKATIGPIANRPSFQFGLDEYLTLCSALGAVPIITMSYFTGTDDDLADLIEYLNYPCGKGNPNGGENWAEERARNGHPEPYGVRYFEFGNEVYHGDHRGIKKVDPREYARRYLVCREKFKQIDPNIKLGIVFQGWAPGMTAWDTEIAGVVKSRLDFAIMHVYPVEYVSPKNHTASEIFTAALATPLKAKKWLESFTAQLSACAGRKVPIAITEYNGWFAEEKPVPFRHCLGNALFNAVLLQTFLYTSAPILCANYWQFSNSHWGLAYNNDIAYYIRRPNYFVFDLFANHFGSSLVHTTMNLHDSAFSPPSANRPETIRSSAEKYKTGPSLSFPYPSNQYLSVAASTDSRKSKLYLLVINKHMQQSALVTIEVKNKLFADSGDSWLLNGNAIDSTNEDHIERVTIAHGKFTTDTQRNTFALSFPPHSITAIEIETRP